MRERIIRYIVLSIALLLLLAFFIFPIEEVSYGMTGNGTDEYEINSGENLSWKWEPDIDRVTEFTIQLTGIKNAQKLSMSIEVFDPDGRKVSSQSKAIMDLGDQSELMMAGEFTEEKEYTFSLRVEGEGSIKIRGTKNEDGFLPTLNWKRESRVRRGILMYFAMGCLTIGLIPLPVGKKDKSRTRKLLLMALLIVLSSFWMYLKLGLSAFDWNEATCFAWGLHFAAWFYFGIIGRLIFVVAIPIEKKAAIAIAMLGLLFIFVLTPKSPPDEYTHFKYAYKVSNYLLLQEDKTKGDARDNDLSAWPEHENTAEGYSQVVKNIFKSRDINEGKTFSVSKTITYPLMYLPQAIGLTIGRCLQVNALILFYLGRIFNLLVYLLCIYFAVKVIPEKKELFFGIGMMPMAIHQAASFSYDAFTNGMAILWTALIFRAVRDEKAMNKREYYILLITGALLAPSKVGYAVLAGLLFLIPKKRFVFWGKQAAVWMIIFTMICTIAVFWLPSVIQGKAVSVSGGELYSFTNILQHPLLVLEVLIFTIEENIANWWMETAGRIFSGYSLEVPQMISITYLMLLFVLSLKKKGEQEQYISIRNRSVAICIVVICILLVELVELMTWTKITSPEVDGIQGRYFIPIIPLIFLSLENRNIYRSSSMDERKLLCAMAFFQAYTIDNIIIRTLWY